MAQAQVIKEYNFYVKGFITEANPLTFPPDASISEDNFDLLRDGSRRRRLGIDFEQDFAITDTGLNEALMATSAIASGLWSNVANDPLISILVVQVGSRLWFFDAFADSISASPLNGGNTVDLPGTASVAFQGVSLFGKLLIVDGKQGFLVLTYNKDTDTITLNARILIVRDIWGVEDGLAINERPINLSKFHEYNLVNQGWGVDKIDESFFYYSIFRIDEGVYPSNSDLVSAGLGSGGGTNWQPNVITSAFQSTTQAAKGLVYLDPFRRGASRVASLDQKSITHNSSDTSGDSFELSRYFRTLTGEPEVDSNQFVHPLFGVSISDAPVGSGDNIAVDETLSGITTISSFSGRAWFSGSTSTLFEGDRRSPNLGGYVFFSQIVDNDTKLGLCHQIGDPTTDESTDVLDTDGGTIQIPEATTIIRLIPVSNGVVAFAENGVWEISGGDSPFTATNISVRKISSSGAIGPNSIVQVDSDIFYWSVGGIYGLTPDKVTGFLSSTNLSETTIQSFFNNISNSSKSFAKGRYDIAGRKIRWVYNNDPSFNGTAFVNKYDRELVFDTVLGAFYSATYQTLGTDSPYIAGTFETPDFNILDVDTPVLANLDPVVVGGDPVILKEVVQGNGSSRLAYIAIVPGTTFGFTIAIQRDAEFVDWMSSDAVGKDAAAFMLTGYEILEDTQRNKQAPYFTANFKRSETGFEQVGDDLLAVNPSSCLVQSQWDYADSPNSGKFSTPFQAYRLLRNYIPTGPGDLFDYGQSVITTKSKLRGRGKALSILFKTEPKHDLHLYGWGIKFTGSTNV